MPILNVVTGQVGLDGVAPRWIYILTNDTIAQVTATGYLNGIVKQNTPLYETDMAVVATKTTPSATSVQVGTYNVAYSSGSWSLTTQGSPGSVVLPTVANRLAHFTDTTGTLSSDAGNYYNAGNISAGLSGTAGTLSAFPATLAKGSLRLSATASTGDTITTITNALQAAARTFTIPDGGQSASNFLISDSAGTQTIATGSLALTLGNITATAGTITATAGNVVAGSSGAAGTFISFPATAANGTLILSALNAGGAFNTTIRNSAMGQSSVISIPDPGAATSKFVLQDGTNTSGTFTTLNAVNLKYGATPVAQVDPASCTITAVAGAADTATITVQLKDGSGTNMARIIPFRVYSSSAADGLTLQSAASTGYSVASGGLSLNNGAAITTQISAISSATGGCVLSLLDTGKQTSYLVLVLANGTKISAQLSAGSYG